MTSVEDAVFTTLTCDQTVTAVFAAAPAEGDDDGGETLSEGGENDSDGGGDVGGGLYPIGFEMMVVIR